MAKSSTRCGSPNHHRELATSLQHNPAASIARLQATSTGSVRASIRRVAGCTTSTGFAGHASAEVNSKLTLHLDHPMGADQHEVIVYCKEHPDRRIIDALAVVFRDERA